MFEAYVLLFVVVGIAAGAYLAVPAMTVVSLAGIIWIAYCFFSSRKRHQDVGLAKLFMGLMALPILIPMWLVALLVRVDVTWSSATYQSAWDFFLR